MNRFIRTGDGVRAPSQEFMRTHKVCTGYLPVMLWDDAGSIHSICNVNQHFSGNPDDGEVANGEAWTTKCIEINMVWSPILGEDQYYRFYVLYDKGPLHVGFTTYLPTMGELFEGSFPWSPLDNLKTDVLRERIEILFDSGVRQQVIPQFVDEVVPYPVYFDSAFGSAHLRLYGEWETTVTHNAGPGYDTKVRHGAFYIVGVSNGIALTAGVNAAASYRSWYRDAGDYVATKNHPQYV